MRLHIDGEIVGEKLLTTSLINDSNLQGLSSISLAGTDGDDDRFHGYVHSLEVMSEPSAIKVHFLKVNFGGKYYFSFCVCSYAHLV